MAEKFRDEDEEPIHNIDDDQSHQKEEPEAIRFGSQYDRHNLDQYP